MIRKLERSEASLVGSFLLKLLTRLASLLSTIGRRKHDGDADG
jgi:hypothetical protein